MKKIMIIILFVLQIISFAQVGESSDFSYGVKLYNDAIYDVAITQFKSFIENHSSSLSAPQAQFYIAESYFMQKKKEDALKNYQKLILNYPKSEFCSKSLIKSAEIYAMEEKYEKAARYYLQLSNYFPKSSLIPENSYKAIEIFFKINAYEEAKENIALLKRNYPVNIFTQKGILILAKINDINNETELAERNYMELVRANTPSDLKQQILFEYATFLLKQQNLIRAKNNFEKVLKLKKVKGDFYYKTITNYARILIDEGKFEKVQKMLPNLKNIPEKYKADILALKGEVFFFKKKYVKAITIFKDAQKISYNADIVFKIAYAYEGLKDYRNAGDALFAITSKESDVTKDKLKTAFLKSAKFYVKGHFFDNAILQYRKFLLNFPKDFLADKIQFLIAKAYYDNKEYRAASVLFEDFINKFKYSSYIDNALNLLGETYENLEKYEEAYKIYNIILKNYPASNYYGIAHNRADFLISYKIKGKKLTDKLAYLSSEFILSGKTSELILNWAKFFYNEQKDFVQAVKFFKIYKTQVLKERKAETVESKFLYASALEKIPAVKKELILKAYEIYSKIVDKEFSSKARTGFFIKSYKNMYEIALEIKTSDDPAGLLQRALDAKIDDMSGFFLYTEAKNIFDTKDYKQVIKISNSFIKKYPHSKFVDEVIYFNAFANEKLMKFEKAKAKYLILTKKENNSDFKLKALQKIILLSNNLNDNEKYFKKIKEIFYYTDFAKNIDEIEADNYARFKENDKALEKYLKLQNKLDSESFSSRWNFNIKSYNKKIADLYMQKNEYRKAEFYYRHYLSKNSSDITKSEVMSKLTIIYRNLNDMDALERNLRDIAEYSKGTNSITADIALADIDFGKGNYNKALGKYRKILKKKIKDKDIKIEVEVKKIQCFYRLNKISSADKEFKAFRKKYKNLYDKKKLEPLFYIEKSGAFLALKSYTKALKGYDALLDEYEISPLIAKAMYGKGMVLYNIGKKEKAFPIWEKLLQKYPDSDISVEASYSLGAMYMNREMYDKAIGALQHVIKYKNKHRLKKHAYKIIIKLYQKLGLNDAALRSIRDYILLYPDEDDVFQKRIEMGNIFQRNRQFDEALKYFGRLMYEAKGDDEASVQFYIAETYMDMKNYRQAISEFLKVKYLIKNSSPLDWGITSVYKSAQCYVALGDKKRAISLLKDILKKYGMNTKYGRYAAKQIKELESNN